MSMLTVLIFRNMIFIISMDMQTFAFVHCVFSTHQHLGIFAPCFTTQVGLQFGTVCSNISTNINLNFHTLGDHLISIIPCKIKFSFPGQVGKKQVYCFQTL
jgi:hypothetical protein